MIETVVSVNLMVEEELKVKKNRLAPDFLSGNEKEYVYCQAFMGMNCRDNIFVMN